MNERPNESIPAEDVREMSEVFEKTLLEMSILDTLYGASDVSDYVKNVLQTSVEELRRFGTLKTLASAVGAAGAAGREREENGQEEWRRFRDEKQRGSLKGSADDEQRTGPSQCRVSLEKNTELLKQKQDEIDLAIEKCTVSLLLFNRYSLKTALRREYRIA